MKDLFKDPDLWRQKRDELPIDTEPQSGWQEMQSLLDLHLPVIPLTPAASVSKVAKIIKAIKAMKAISVLIASLTVATVTGTAIYLVKSGQHEKAQHHQSKIRNHIVAKDSLMDSLTANSSNLNDSVGVARDSLKDLNTQKNEQTSSVNRNDSINNAAKTNQANNIGKSQTGGALHTLTVKHQSALSTLQKNNNNIIKGQSTGNSGYNNSASVHTGKYQNNKQPVARANKNAQQALTNSIDEATINNQPDDQNVQDGSLTNGTSTLSANKIQSWQLAGINNNNFTQPQLFANQPLSKFVIGNYYYNRLRLTTNKQRSNSKIKAGKKQSNTNNKTRRANSLGRSLSAAFANTDWGILLGANSSGSFTSGAQNSNFYGSFPVDIYAGLFTTYHLNNRWAINAQVRLLTPLNLSGSYDNKNYSNVDSAQFVKVTDSRKAYFVNVPIHVMYKINNNISIKGGPVINLPVKQINGNTNLQRLDINLDTTYFANALNKIKTTRYDQKMNIGLSGGVNIQFNRLIFEALYQKSLSGYMVTSDFGNYKTNPGSLQISVGFKLNSSKHH
jgi:hypothetical protein